MATMTITTTALQAQRLATAFGRGYGLKDAAGVSRDATAAEIKTFTIDWLRRIVLDQERQSAALAAVDTTFDPT